MAEMEGHHQEEMKVKLEAQLREMENKITDAVERARLEGKVVDPSSCSDC